MTKHSFPPPSNNAGRGGYADLYDEVAVDKETKGVPYRAVLSVIILHAVTIVLYSALIAGLLSIARESRVVDWQISFINLATAVFLVQGLRMWDHAIHSRRQ